MAKIKGVTITLVDKVETGKDPFGKTTYETKEVEVHNVLIAPTSTEDIVNQQSLTGKKAVYTLAIPKGDTHEWVDREVHFFGEKWRTVGFPIQGIEDLIPLDWNKKVTVERYG